MVQVLYPNELQTPELALEYLDYAPHKVLHEPTFHFLMRAPGTAEPVGRINLRNSHAPLIEKYAGHLGFAVDEAHRGHGYAALAVRMLLPLAARLGLRPLWITCDKDNSASRRTCERAGATLVEVVHFPSGIHPHFSEAARYRLDL